MSTIWGNVDGFVDQYRCATTLYLLSMLAQVYNIISFCGVGVPVRGIEFVPGFYATDRRLLSMLIKILQLPGAAAYESHMKIHTSNANTDISLSREFLKHIS